MPAFRTLDEADLRGKRVLLRVDLNVPMDGGKISDPTRLERVAPTIAEIADKSGKVILLSHFGRPKGRNLKDSLKPVADALAGVLHRPVGFADDCIGDAAQAAVTLARQTLDAEQKKLEAGVSNPTAVLQMESSRTTTESTLVSAMAAYAKARVEMDRATGLLLDNAGIVLADAEKGEVTHMPKTPFVAPRTDLQTGTPPGQAPPQ